MSNKFTIQILDNDRKDSACNHEPIPDTVVKLYAEPKKGPLFVVTDNDDQIGFSSVAPVCVEKADYEGKSNSDGMVTFEVSDDERHVSFYTQIENDLYHQYPFPMPFKTTKAFCHTSSDNIQRLRFKTKKLVVCRVKAYSLNDNEETLTISNDEAGYLSNVSREVYAITKDQKIMLRAFLVDYLVSKQQQDERQKTPQGEGYANKKDDIIFLNGENLESIMKDEIVWAYKLVNNDHFSRPHSNPLAATDYVKITGTEDDPKTGLSISLKLSDIITEIKPNQIVVFFAFPRGYEDNDETDEIKPRYCSEHGVYRSSGKTEQRVKHIASIGLKVIEDRYRLLYDGREFILLDNERISKTYSVIKNNTNTWEPSEGIYSVKLASKDSLLASSSGDNPKSFHITDEIAKTYYVATLTLDLVRKRLDEASSGEVIIVSGIIGFLCDDIVKKGVKTLQVKFCEETFIEITRFKQTMNSTTSKYITYIRQKNGIYTTLYALGGEEKDKVKLPNKPMMDGEDIYKTMYCGYILECPGPDTIMGGLELRIPEGYYNAIWHERPKKTKKPPENVLKLYSDLVSADRLILIHKGNNPIDIEGCLLPGTLKKKKDGNGYEDDTVGSSGDKVKNIEDIVVQSIYKGKELKSGVHLPITVIIKNEFEMEE